MILPFADELQNGWLAKGQLENRVKAYISYVGSLMLREPDSHGILSDRKLAKISAMEYPTGTLDEVRCGTAPCKPRTKSKSITTFDIVSKIRQRYPKGEFHFVPIDTTGIFEYNGRRFKMSDEVAGYAPKQTSLGTLYDMDKVVILDSGCLRFFDQNFGEIPGEMIEVAGCVY